MALPMEMQLLMQVMVIMEQVQEKGREHLLFLDVTDVSQVKVKFTIVSITGSSYVKGSTTEITTGFTFIRIGDT